MEQSIKVGLSFGLTSGIITTLGLMVGLNAGTASQLVVIGGILTIAIADAASDALGMHISQESDKESSSKEIWTATISTFIAKFVFALTFVVPVLIFELNTAILVSIAWGLALLALFSYYIAKQNKEKPIGVIGEHVTIALLVIITTNFVGDWIASVFS